MLVSDKVLTITILVLLLSAIALHQIAYGLVLIGGFSLGLASVLTSLGLAAVYGRQWLEKAAIGTGIIAAAVSGQRFSDGLRRSQPNHREMMG